LIGPNSTVMKLGSVQQNTSNMIPHDSRGPKRGLVFSFPEEYWQPFLRPTFLPSILDPQNFRVLPILSRALEDSHASAFHERTALFETAIGGSDN